MRRYRGQKLLFVDELERQRWPALLVPIIVSIDFVLFIVTMYVNDCPRISGSNCTLSFLGRISFQPMSDNPLLGPSASAYACSMSLCLSLPPQRKNMQNSSSNYMQRASWHRDGGAVISAFSYRLARMGGLSLGLVAREHQIWRPFSCIWLHAGFFHVLSDLISLLLVGIRLEQQFGCWRIGCIYFLSGIGGSLFSALFVENRVSVGSSGALFGLMGAIVSEFLPNWELYTQKTETFSAMALIGLVNFILGLFPHIDNFANLGGFVFGMLLGLVLFMRPHVRGSWDSDPNYPPPGLAYLSDAARRRLAKIFVWSLAIVLLLILYLLLMVLAFTGVDASSHCLWCRSFSCIPSSHWKCGDEMNGGLPLCKYVITGTTLLLTCEADQKSQQYTGWFSTAAIKRLCTELCSGA